MSQIRNFTDLLWASREIPTNSTPANTRKCGGTVGDDLTFSDSRANLLDFKKIPR